MVGFRQIGKLLDERRELVCRVVGASLRREQHGE